MAGARARSLAVELAALAALLFVARFLLRAHLIVAVDQECHIGGIAVDVLAHGVRFPLASYAPNEYDNGSFVNGLMTAGAFALLGRNLLAAKLVTHAYATGAALAGLALLRQALDELGFTAPRRRRTAIAALLIGLALATPLVTMRNMLAVGNHAEGPAIDVMLLALFARRRHVSSPPWTASLWALVGVALYVNKGTLIVVPVLALLELELTPRDARRLGAGVVGFLVGVAPELLVILKRHGLGWLTLSHKLERNAPAFPRNFFSSLYTLAGGRVELLILWATALVVGMVLTRRRRSFAVRVATLFTLTHLAVLTVMAQGGLDSYALYSYTPLMVLVAITTVLALARVEVAYPRQAGVMAIALLVALAVAYRPDALRWGGARVLSMWRNHEAAACSWRFAEGFGREYDHGLAASEVTREQHQVARCRLLSEPAQVLDCIGGIARELHWRLDGRVEGAPPAGLSHAEQRAYAFWYGTHRSNFDACRDFVDPALRKDCADAVRLDCLLFADMLERFMFAHQMGPPHCPIGPLPIAGFWTSILAQLQALPTDGGPPRVPAYADGFAGCAPVFAACY